MYNLFFKRFFSFKGRSSRKEYIARLLLTALIVCVSLLLCDYISSHENDWKDERYYINRIIIICGLISLIFMYMLIFQYFPLSVRRLHDLNEHGSNVLLTTLPLSGFFITRLMFEKGTPGTNKYGEPPTY